MTVDAVERLIDDAGGVANLITPRGWPHLGLVIIDACWSLRSNYDTVVTPLLASYCDAAPDLTWATAGEPPHAEHDAQRLIDFLGPIPLEARYTILNRNVGPGTVNRRADGTTKGKPKAEIVVEVAQILVEEGVVTRADFVEAAPANPGLQWRVRQVPGVGFACWKYLLSLSGVEVAKPDVMVLRWLAEATGGPQSDAAGAALIESATRDLQTRGIDVTVRQVDHLVWRKASGRSLGHPPLPAGGP